MLENFDPNETNENQKNDNTEIISGVLDLSGDILTDTTNNTEDNSAEITDAATNAAEEIEIMTIQDVVDEVADGAINFVGDIFDDFFD